MLAKEWRSEWRSTPSIEAACHSCRRTLSMPTNGLVFIFPGQTARLPTFAAGFRLPQELHGSGTDRPDLRARLRVVEVDKSRVEVDVAPPQSLPLATSLLHCLAEDLGSTEAGQGEEANRQDRRGMNVLRFLRLAKGLPEGLELGRGEGVAAAVRWRTRLGAYTFRTPPA